MVGKIVIVARPTAFFSFERPLDTRNHVIAIDNNSFFFVRNANLVIPALKRRCLK